MRKKAHYSSGDQLKLPSRRFSVPSATGAAVLVFVSLSASPDPALAQTFNDALIGAVNNACAEGNNSNPLAGYCNDGGTAGTTGSTGNSGVGSTAAPIAIQERLRRLTEETDKGGDLGSGGASADVAAEIAPGLSLFISPGYQRVSHRNNRFEDGYSSNGAIVTAGTDYQFTDFLIAGVALNYTYDDGNFDDGGGFDNQGYGAFLYASLTPFEGAFAQLVGGYRRRNYDERRDSSVTSSAGNSIGGRIDGDYSGNEWSTGLLAGYDYPVENFTVGPRAGLNVVHNTFDDYTETGNTGLELDYNSDEVTSIQSSLGVVATMAISTGFGVVLPQVEAAWIHEFNNDQRNIQASLRDATNSGFKYETEEPDRNFARLGVGVSTVLPNRIQPFASVSTIAGNSKFWTLTGTIGLRMDL